MSCDADTDRLSSQQAQEMKVTQHDIFQMMDRRFPAPVDSEDPIDPLFETSRENADPDSSMFIDHTGELPKGDIEIGIAAPGELLATSVSSSVGVAAVSPNSMGWSTFV